MSTNRINSVVPQVLQSPLEAIDARTRNLKKSTRVTVADVLELNHVRASIDDKQFDVERVCNSILSWHGRQAKTEESRVSRSSFSDSKKVTKGSETTKETWESGETESRLYSLEEALLRLERQHGIAIPKFNVEDFNLDVYLAGFSHEQVNARKQAKAARQAASAPVASEATIAAGVASVS